MTPSHTHTHSSSQNGCKTRTPPNTHPKGSPCSNTAVYLHTTSITQDSTNRETKRLSEVTPWANTLQYQVDDAEKRTQMIEGRLISDVRVLLTLTAQI